MAAKKIIDEVGNGWVTAVGEGGQIELVQSAQGGPDGNDENGNGHRPVQDVTAFGAPVLIPLADIHANPYQPRTQDDPAAVAEIALSIYRSGLMQIPVARRVTAHYELAFGHTRYAAYVLLSVYGLPDQGIAPDERYAVMPLYFRDLDDRTMFEMAVSENLKRRDLNAIEQAAAMKAYMAEFQASSREAGELFGVSDATVRGTVRLLNLPEAVQQKIAAGELSQGAARKLIAVARIDPAIVLAAANTIAEGNDPDGTISYRLRTSKTATEMWESWRKGDLPRGGPSLWLLSDPAPSGLPELTFRQIVAICAPLGFIDPKQAKPDEIDAFEKKVRHYWSEMTLPAGTALPSLLYLHPEDEELLERIHHLLRPPSCQGCQFHAVVQNAHWCGFKACHARKAKDSAAYELAALSKKLGIAVYDKAVDGADVAPLNTSYYDDETKVHKQMFDDRHADLRLVPMKKSQYSDKYTDSHVASVVLVGESARSTIEARKKASSGGSHYQDYNSDEAKRKRARIEELSKASDKFYNDQAPQPFAVVFSTMSNVSVMCALLGESLPKHVEKRSALLADLRVKLTHAALRRGLWEVSRKGPTALAKHLKKVAVTWGVELPADWLDVAKQYEPVSTETPKGKAK